MLNYELARAMQAERVREVTSRLRSVVLRPDRAPMRGRNLRGHQR